VVALDKASGKILQVGAEARALLGRTPGHIAAVCPLRQGIIADYEMTERLLRECMRRASVRWWFKPRLTLCVPWGISKVEERALIDAGLQAGARRVSLMETPLAAALGAGLEIARAEGRMVVDVGTMTTNIAVLSLSGIVEAVALPVAGAAFDDALIKYIRRTRQLLIGESTAEDLKRRAGSVLPEEGGETVTVTVKGRCLETGLPGTRTLSSDELQAAFTEPAASLAEGIRAVLERTPPELAADIAQNGIVLTGGGSLLDGLDRLLTKETGIETRVAAEAETCAALGLRLAVDR
jgi:rod shape-determining protein MreB